VSKTAARQAIEGVQNIVLATHVRPDGDALGSMFGFADILRMTGRRIICYLEKPIADLYSFLSPCVTIETDFEKIQAFVAECGDDIMGISLDCGDLTRLGEHGDALRAIKPFLVIDHHQGNKGFGDLQWIEPHRSSTGEMIYDLVAELGVADKISKEAAECLYTAIVTDTGSFQYDSTSGHTFKVAGQLIDLGVKPAYICQNLYDNASFGSLQLMQLVISTLKTYVNDQVAVIQVSQKMLQATGTSYEDCEGLINFPRSVRDVRVAVFLKEGEQGTGQVSVSLRAKGDCDVAEAAAEFTGGGHRNAAGFRIQGHSMEQVCEMLLPILERALIRGAEKQ
jgi:phosphoesterase RecJ-like protein